MSKKSVKDQNPRDSNSISPYLLWLDMEMSGLNPETDVILEIAIIITDTNLNIVDKLSDMVIYQSDEILSTMDSWNQKMHKKSGLIEKVKNSQDNITNIENKILNFIGNYFSDKSQAILCGNSIYQDRKFIIKYMPKFEAILHYRLIDISSIKELAKRWYPNMPKFEKHNKHEALADIEESIAELLHYKKYIFLPNISQ